MKKTLKAMILITAASFFLASCGNAGILPGAKNPVTSNYRAAGNTDSGSAGTFSAVNGGKSKSSETAAAAADQTANGSSGTETAAETSDSQKLIRTVNFTFTTARLSGIMPAAKDLAGKARDLGGYVSRNAYHSSEYSESADLEVKVPAEKTDEFITFAEGLSGKISDLQDAVEDVSLQYTDTETRIKTLREEQKRLMSYMDKTTSVAELKQLEDSIQDVTQRLESAESQMKVMDSRINYTTISIRVTSGETSLTEKSSNLREALKDFFTNLQNSTAVLITVISFLLPFAILAFLIVLLIRFIRKKRRARQNRAAAAPQTQNAQVAPASQAQNPQAQSTTQTSIHQQWDTPAQNPPANPKDRKPTA